MSKTLKVVEHAKTPSEKMDPIFSLLERISTDRSVSIEAAEQAFAFYQKVEADRARKKFNAAFIAAQNEMGPILRNKDNKQTGSRYATHDALDSVLRPIYSRHGLAPTFDTLPSDKPAHIKITMTLLHASGHERTYQIDMPADGKGAKGGDVMTLTHAAGSAVSYGRRYLLIAAFNLSFIDKRLDDDGNAAGGSQATITDKQVRELEALLEGTSSDKAKFLAIGGLETLEDMPASKFDSAKALLMKKLGGRR